MTVKETAQATTRRIEMNSQELYDIVINLSGSTIEEKAENFLRMIETSTTKAIDIASS